MRPSDLSAPPSPDDRLIALADSAEIRDAQPAIWSANGVEILPGFDSDYNWCPHSLSEDGSVVVGYRWPRGQLRYYGPADGIDRATPFLWRSGHITLLGTLPGYRHSIARGVSGDGRIVVGHCHEAPNGRSPRGWFNEAAFVWDAAHGLRDLNELLVRQNLANDWHLQTGTGISRDGSTIIGRGINAQGDNEAWRARLPAHLFEKPHESPRRSTGQHDKLPPATDDGAAP